MQKRIFAQNFKQAREELKSLLKVFVFRLLILVAVSIGALIVLGSVLLLATWYDGYVDNNTLPEGAKEVKIRTLDGKYRDFVYTVEHGDWFSEEGVDARIWLEEGPNLSRAYFIYFDSSTGSVNRVWMSIGQKVFTKCIMERTGFNDCVEKTEAQEDPEHDYRGLNRLDKTKFNEEQVSAEAQNILNQIIALEPVNIRQE